MALVFNNDHIIFYHIYAIWSGGLAQNHFAHPDYLVILCCVHATYISPDDINQTGPHTYHYATVLKGEWDIHLSALHVMTS